MTDRIAKLIRRNAEATNRWLDPARPETHVDVREEYAAWERLTEEQRAHWSARLDEEIAEIEKAAEESPGRLMRYLRAQGAARARMRAARRKPNQPGMRALRRRGLVRVEHAPLGRIPPRADAAPRSSATKRRTRAEEAKRREVERADYEAALWQAHKRAGRPLPCSADAVDAAARARGNDAP